MISDPSTDGGSLVVELAGDDIGSVYRRRVAGCRALMSGASQVTPGSQPVGGLLSCIKHDTREPAVNTSITE